MYIYAIMEFEFDIKKSSANKIKHGIDFNEAQALWDDPDYIVVPAKTADETRFLVIGKISSDYWSAVVTYRADRTRIISVRRSRNEEVIIYEST